MKIIGYLIALGSIAAMLAIITYGILYEVGPASNPEKLVMLALSIIGLLGTLLSIKR